MSRLGCGFGIVYLQQAVPGSLNTSVCQVILVLLGLSVL